MSQQTRPEVKTVAISRDDVGWAIDAMQIRAEAYERTADYLKTHRFEEEPFEIEEVSDENEARAIAKSYREAIKRIERSLKTRK